MIKRRQWQAVEKMLPDMSKAELLQLRGMVDAELERLAELEWLWGSADTEAEARLEEQGGDTNGAKGGKGGGYVELKMINGSGPYAYKRARVGGRLTSTYIGKVKQ